MASHEGSRKRQKMSRPSGQRVNGCTTATGSSSSSGPSGMSNSAAVASGSCSHEQALKTLHTDIEAMRHLITCKICDRLLYEPYALACGHTYCYQCLRQWFENNPRKKTCPDCRVVITQQPTPSYLLREMVLIFVSRNEMLPDGETTEDHHKWQKEEADLIAADKANTDERTGGLFKGMFKRAHGVMRGYGAMHDPGDNVDRCPMCHWEIEGGYCGHCDAFVDEDAFSDYDDDSDSTGDELDHELDEEDAAAVWGPDGEDVLYEHEYLHDQFGRDDSHPPGPIPMRASGIVDLSGSTDNEDGSEDEEDGNLTGFVVGDDEVAYAESDDGGRSEVTDVPRQRRSRRAVVISDDESDSEPRTAPAIPPAPINDDDDDDGDDDGPVITGSQRNKRGSRMAVRQRHVSVSSTDHSSDDSSDSDSSDDDNFSHADVGRNALARNVGGFSPLNEHEDSNAPTPHDYYSDQTADTDFYHEGAATFDDNQYIDDRWDAQSPSIDDDGYDNYEDDDGWGGDETRREITRTATAPPHARPMPSARPIESYTGNFGRNVDRLGPPTTARGSYASASNRTTNGGSSSNHTDSRRRQAFPDGMPTRNGNRARPISIDEDEDAYLDNRRTTHRPRLSAASTSNQATTNNRQPNDNATTGRRAQGTPNARSATRSGQSSNRTAPRHPFQLENTLASVNNSYNRRVHAPMMDRYLAPSQPSSDSDGSEITIVHERGGRRKRALSIDSDAPVDGEGIWDHE